MRHRTRILGTLLLLAATLYSCGSSTNLTAVWRDPNFHGLSGPTILVVALGDNERNVRLWEDGMMKALQSQGAYPFAGTSFLPVGSAPPDSAAALGAIRKSGANLMMVTRLLGVNKEQVYVPGSAYYSPSPSYYGWYGYYNSSYATVTAPGYYETHTTVNLETNVYDLTTGELAWSAESSTFNPASANEVVNSVTETVAAHLVSSGVIKKK